MRKTEKMKKSILRKVHEMGKRERERDRERDRDRETETERMICQKVNSKREKDKSEEEVSNPKILIV